MAHRIGDTAYPAHDIPAFALNDSRCPAEIKTAYLAIDEANDTTAALRKPLLTHALPRPGPRPHPARVGPSGVVRVPGYPHHHRPRPRWPGAVGRVTDRVFVTVSNRQPRRWGEPPTGRAKHRSGIASRLLYGRRGCCDARRCSLNVIRKALDYARRYPFGPPGGGRRVIAYRMSEAARAYRVLPTSRQRYDDRQRVAPFKLDEEAIRAWRPLGPDAVRAEITRQLVAEYGRRARTPGEYRLLVRWLRYRVTGEMAARYPESGPESVEEVAPWPEAPVA